MGFKAVFKAGFKKAYDSVDWNTLFLVMEKMGFGSRWINWIRRCVTTASVSVLVNGVPTEEIPMAKGLRQGCPLSPLLFNFIGEILNLLILKAVSQGLFSGLIIRRDEGSFKLSHLQFADDLIIFSGASKTQILNVKRVLRVFQVMSGLQLNMKKCKLFGVNLNDEVVHEWAHSIGCSVGSFPSDYLGLPLGATRNSAAIWNPVISNFSKKLTGWKAASLSLAGRLDLWALDYRLMLIFPRLFSISINKTGKLVDFGEYSSTGWSWEVQFRRNLNDWEIEQWANLMAVISSFTLSMDSSDGMIWKGTGDGLFTVKSAVKLCSFGSLGSEEAYFWNKIVWKGQLPPKVESFMWQVVLGRLAVKTELVKRGVSGIQNLLCPLCMVEEESPSNLFFSCSMVWSVWNKFLNFWRIKIVFHSNAKTFLLAWDALRTNSKIWSLIPGVVMWTTWKLRNLIVFEGGDCCSFQPNMIMSTLPWHPPPKGFVKINVDAATTKDWKKSGLGGVLKDSSGHTLGSFKELADPGPPTYMELKAIQKGLIFFADFRDRLQDWLIVESDSKIALDWIKGVDFCPDVYAILVTDIVHRLIEFVGVVRWVNRTANIEADALAKEGIAAGGFSMGQVVQEAEPVFSDAHEGLCLCSSRFLFPVWELPVMVVKGGCNRTANIEADALAKEGIAAGGFSMGQVVQEAEPVFSDAHEGLCLCSSRFLFPVWELPVMVVKGGYDAESENGLIACRLSVGAMQVLENKIRALEMFLRSRRNKRRGLYGCVAGLGDMTGSILYGTGSELGASDRSMVRNLFGAYSWSVESNGGGTSNKRRRLPYSPAELAAMEVVWNFLMHPFIMYLALGLISVSYKSFVLQVRAMECIRQLLLTSAEALFLLQLVSQHHVTRLVQGFDANIHQELVQSTFHQFVCSEEGDCLATRLISASMEYYTGPDGRGTVDINVKLREGCPSYFKEEAFEFLGKVPESADLRTLCKLLEDLRFYEAVVCLPLQKALALDPAGDAFNEQIDQAIREFAIAQGEHCYDIITSALRSLKGEGSQREFGSPSRPAAVQSVLDNASQRKFICHIVQLSVQSPDRLFHEYLYRTMIDLGLENELLEYGGPDLVPFLQTAGCEPVQEVRTLSALTSATPSVGQPGVPIHSNQAKYFDLLARYFVLERQHLLAAHVLLRLAERRSINGSTAPSLEQR
ncbi:NUP155 protein [Hibiscus syriacus]|uniref:NUP155 protein n=1 Tax=Hibiscus syriacus TaxID=106335 RepID=A0A6A2XDM0_HIBSY|nr:NUP155 protein [Hibiscus syriacus]